MSSNAAETEDTTVYRVVVNLEDQYSIWPDGQQCPSGWTATGPSGSKAECLAYIKETWTDMRPASLRRAMAELARSSAPMPPPLERSARRHESVVDRLSAGDHPVELGLRPERSVQVLANAIDKGVVHVTFTGTRGGTEIGVPLDRERCDVTTADLQRGRGAIHLEGELSLNFVKVRCVVDVDLATLAGTGHLIKLTAA
jgi:uncharacterized protein YbdZ (MbtH family)